VNFINLINEELVGIYKDIYPELPIFKNPKSLDNIGHNTKGIIYKDGNLYIEEDSALSYQKLYKWLKINKHVGTTNAPLLYLMEDGEIICVERENNTNNFYLGNIYYEDEISSNQADLMQKTLNKAKLKNPKYMFVNQKIDQ